MSISELTETLEDCRTLTRFYMEKLISVCPGDTRSGFCINPPSALSFHYMLSLRLIQILYEGRRSWLKEAPVTMPGVMNPLLNV